MGHSRWALLGCAALTIAAGTFPLLDALEFFPGSAARLNAPRWVVMIAGALFIAAGLYLALMAILGEGAARSFGRTVGMATLLGLAAIANWVAFGGGDRAGCSGGFADGVIGVSTGVSETECRAGFGYGALLLDALTVRALAHALRERCPQSPFARGAETAAHWAMGLLLLPLFGLVWALTRGRDGAARIASRFRRSPGEGPRPGADG